MLRFALGLVLASPLVSAAPVMATEAPAATHQQLVSLFAEWRAFNHPAIVRGRPDYSEPAMTAKVAGLSTFKHRLAAIDTKGWTASQRGDYRLVEAEMNGLDFFLREWMRSELGPEAYYADRIIELVRAAKKIPELIKRIDEHYPPKGAAPPPPPLPDVAVIEHRNWWGYALALLIGAAVGTAAMLIV